jgi:hypothetical protein
MRRTAVALVTATVLLVACGDDDDTETATDSTQVTTAEPQTTTTTTTTTGEGDGGTVTTAGEGELPGERIEIFPYEDAALAVVGVAADDVLNVRDVPGTGGEVVAELEPVADGLTATGHNRQLDGGAIWAEVDTGEATGWVSTAFVAHVGTTDDVTSAVYPDAATRPLADTLEQLAEQVARDVAGEAEPSPRVVVVDGPAVGDLGEVTVDVLDLPDDSVLGQRLRIFAEPEGGEAFRLRTIESTTLCRRGVSDGACV